MSMSQIKPTLLSKRREDGNEERGKDGCYRLGDPSDRLLWQGGTTGTDAPRPYAQGPLTLTTYRNTRLQTRAISLSRIFHKACNDTVRGVFITA